jgi:hypothetical protein
MAADAEEAMSVAASGDVQFCIYTTLILCFDEDESRVDEAAALVVKTVQNLGFACRIETVNRQCYGRMARKPARGRLSERSQSCAAHAEPGRHDADHGCLGGLETESVAADAT